MQIRKQITVRERKEDNGNEFPEIRTIFTNKNKGERFYDEPVH